MLCNMCADLMNTLLVVHDGLHINTLGKLCLIGIRQVACQDIKLAVHRISVHTKVNRYRLKVKRQCSMVADRIREGILAHISAAVLSCTECCKRILVQTVDRCTCHTEEECVRQGRSHLDTEVTFLRPVALIDHYDDVVTLAEFSGDLLEAEDSSDDNLPNILAKHGHELVSCRCRLQVSDVRRMELCCNLRLQIQTVIDNDNSRILKVRQHTKLNSGKLHKV